MKQRVLTAIATLLFAVTLISTGIAPACAYAPPDGEGSAVIQSEAVRWYYRNRDGVDEMRLWSITYQYWKTAWIPVPDDWTVPGK